MNGSKNGASDKLKHAVAEWQAFREDHSHQFELYKLEKTMIKEAGIEDK